MAHILAAMQSDPALLPCLLACLETRSSSRSERRGAVGLGYFENGKVLLRKRPWRPDTLPLDELAADVRTDVFLAARETLEGGFLESEAQPHRFRNWMFAGTGAFLDLAEARARLIEALPAFLRRGLGGQTGSELAFLTALGELSSATRNLERLELEPDDVVRSLGQMVRRLDALAQTYNVKSQALSAVLTNGRLLAALRRGEALYYTLVEGIGTCARCGVDRDTSDSDPRSRPHRQLRGVVLSTAPQSEAFNWLEVPERQLLTVSRAFEVRLQPFRS